MCLAPEENLEPNSADLKRSRAREGWHKSLEESHSARLRRDHCLVRKDAMSNPKKGSRIGCFPCSRV